MEQPVRRVVTGHDAEGRSIVASNSLLEPGAIPHDLYLWTSDQTPADNRQSGDAAQVPQRLEPPASGSVFRVVEFPPESALEGLSAEQREGFFASLFAGMDATHCRVDTRRSAGMHRTSTLDYVIVLRGQITLLLDEGEATLHPGDTVVQRGTNHDWTNRGDTPALIAVVMLDANPFDKGDDS